VSALAAPMTELKYVPLDLKQSGKFQPCLLPSSKKHIFMQEPPYFSGPPWQQPSSFPSGISSPCSFFYGLILHLFYAWPLYRPFPKNSDLFAHIRQRIFCAQQALGY
jgi:hypothetical protein